MRSDSQADREQASSRRATPTRVLLALAVLPLAIIGAFTADNVLRARDLQAAKTAAERASRAESDFLSRMSHELRTPMNAILGFAQVLQLGDALDPRQRSFVDEIRQAGEHLLELIEELLDLSRIEAGRLALTLQGVRVGDVVAEAARIVGPLAAHHAVDLRSNGDPAARAQADPTRLRQILVNLLGNAVKYKRRGGCATIAWQEVERSRVRVSVSDTGRGIPPDKRALVFQPFERLGEESGSVDGTGIGLALSKQLAELMGGRIGFDSTPGEGATFWLELPGAEDAASASKAGDAAPAAGVRPGLDMLYAADNETSLAVVDAMLQTVPRLRLVTAADGPWGLELARRQRPDVILLDDHLPGMDGFGVLAALKADPGTAAIPLIALSADAMADDIDRALKAGFAMDLTKPVKLAQLVAAIEAAAAGTTLAERA